MNRVFLIGNLTRDPELIETSSHIPICHFSIAVNRSYTGQDGERKTDFFNVTAWRGLGESVAKYAKKGNKVCVMGSIEIRNYEDMQGNKRIAVDIVANDVEFLTPKSSSYGYEEPGAGEFGNPAPRKAETNDVPELQNIDDDDIPF